MLLKLNAAIRKILAGFWQLVSAVPRHESILFEADLNGDVGQNHDETGD